MLYILKVICYLWTIEIEFAFVLSISYWIRDSQPFLNGDTLDKTSAIPWHPTHGETPTPTFHSIRKENT
jgi:hypothetical protein